MKQKFEIKKSEDGKKILLVENSQLEKEKYTFVCEESYEIDDIKNALKDKNINSLIKLIRTDNIYPVYEFTKTLAKEIEKFVNNKTKETKEILFNDLDLIDETIEGKVDDKKVDTDIDDAVILDENEKIDITTIPKKILSINSSKKEE